MISLLFFILTFVYSSEQGLAPSMEPSLNMVMMDESDSKFKLLFTSGISNVEYSLKPIINVYFKDYFWAKLNHSQSFLNLGLDFYFYRFLNKFEFSTLLKYGGAGNNNFFLEGGLNLKHYLTWLKYFDLFYLKIGMSYIHLENVIKETKTFYFNQSGLASTLGLGTQVLTVKNIVFSVELEQKFLYSNRLEISSDGNKTNASDYIDGAVSFQTILFSVGCLL